MFSKRDGISSGSATAFLGTVGISSIIGILLMFGFALLVSVVIGNVTHYEAFYPFVCIFLQCVPGFVSTRLSLNRFGHALLVIAIIQSAVISAVLFLISLILYGKNVDIKSFLISMAYVLISSFVAVMLRKPHRKKNKAR